MEINFDDIKKEFNAFENRCETDVCEDESEEEGSFIDIVKKYMLAPANCGIYFSRLDLKVIGLKYGEDIQVRERNRMLRDLLKSITSIDEMQKLFEIIKEETNEKLRVYKELIENFLSSKEIFEDKIKKAEKFKEKLDLIIKEGI